MKRLQLNIQLFAEDEMIENNDNSQIEGQMSFDDVLGSNKDYQSEFDRRMSKALETAKSKWQVEYDAKLQAEKSEAEKLAKMDAEQKLNYELKKTRDELSKRTNELNAISLYKTASQMATEKGLPVEYLNLINFNNVNAEGVNEIMDKIVDIRNKDMEKYLKSTLRENPPMQRQTERQKIDPYIAGFYSYFE